jgi:drug/metabolite transporter (DMT)-like permease
MSTLSSSRATAVGFAAILLWSGLALLTALTAGIPPFELLALSFGVAFAASLAVIGRKGAGGFRAWRQPWPVWASGFAGIFLYHAFYFFALKAAPPVEASLINYLWPLLIVVFSALIAREPLQARQLLGALLGLAGTIVVVLARQGGEAAAGGNPLAGYAAAAGGALVWSLYSVNNRRFKGVPGEVMGGICGLVAAAGLVFHLLFEETVMPGAPVWACIVGLGLGPVGLAFFAWDYATKHGRLALLGVLSYFAPLLSTALLIASGQAPARPAVLVAALLIIGGAALAGLGSRRREEAVAKSVPL